MEYNTVNGGTISVTEYDNPTCTSFAVKNGMVILEFCDLVAHNCMQMIRLQPQLVKLQYLWLVLLLLLLLHCSELKYIQSLCKRVNDCKSSAITSQNHV